MRRVIPYPFLFVSLLLVWLLLTSFTPGQLVLGLIVSTVATHAMAALEPPPVTIGSWSAVLRLFGVVLRDITSSNWAVLKLVISDRDGRQAGFAAVPLELRDRTGLAVLALIINCAPGTAWLEYDTDAGIALIHVLDFPGDVEVTDYIKSRYERLLMEIFE